MQIGDIIAGSVGVILQVYPNDPGVTPIISFTGTTPSLLIGMSPLGVQNPVPSLPLTVSLDGTYATYTLTGNEFLSGGNYTVQLQVLDGGNTFLSDEQVIVVSPYVNQPVFDP